MLVSSIVSALCECETGQKNNLIGVLAVVKLAHSSKKDAHVASIVRGLCTHNGKLLAMAQACSNELAADPDSTMDIFKLFVNEFILWYDCAFVVFEKYLECFPMEGDVSVLEKPLLHSGCYPAFADSTIPVIRNPFVADKLHECKTRSIALLRKYDTYNDNLRLNNISFDRIRAIGGHNVSCFFTLSQIVERTENEPLYLGSEKVEFLLLNLLKKSHNNARYYDALAVISVPEDGSARSVLFPPFRINELSMSYSKELVKFTTLSLVSQSNEDSFAICGPEQLILSWFAKLARIFPTDTKLVLSQDLNLNGLGINTVSDTSDSDSKSGSSSDSTSDLDSGNTSPSVEQVRVSEESRRGSLEIMKKTLSNSGISKTADLEKTLQVVKGNEPRNSVKADYDYADVESAVDLDSLQDNITSGFEMVTASRPAKPVTQSLPDLSATFEKPKPVYMNAAGSAIDINNFGKSYNPSFCSTESLNATNVPSGSKSGNAGTKQQKARSSSIFSIFKRNKSKETLLEELPVAELSVIQDLKTIKDLKVIKDQKATKVSKDSKDLKPKGQTTSKQSSAADAKLPKRPELSIEVPKIGSVLSSSQPLSATSSTFGRTLPLPFALPSSTSTYFFKPQIPTSLGSSNNNSTSSLGLPENEEVLKVPNELKDIVNSDKTIDFYISPSTPKSLKVSRWKQKYGKWEMLTTSENLFVKIVANYVLHKSWLLVFKEEYDEEYKEVIDKPVLMLNIDANAKVRQSSALDLEIDTVNSVTNERILIIARCFNGALLSALKSNLENILGVMSTRPSLMKSATFDSNNTIASSLMSTKPSASSTLTSIYTALNDTKQTPPSTNVAASNDEVLSDGEMVLLDRATIRLHKQQDSYEKIYQLSSWKTITMYSLQIFHGMDSFKKGSYQFQLESLDSSVDEELESLTWRIDEDAIFDKIERIGKAAILLKVKEDEIYMLECKGKKEVKRLYELF